LVTDPPVSLVCGLGLRGAGLVAHLEGLFLTLRLYYKSLKDHLHLIMMI
jgi:hypothetical protein